MSEKPHERDQREAAERDAAKSVERHAERMNVQPLPPVSIDDAPAWQQEIYRQFVESQPTMQPCQHLQRTPVQPSKWLALVPDLLICNRPECERTVVETLEERLAGSTAARCSACSRIAPCGSVSFTIDATMLRGVICKECKDAA